MIAKFLFLIFPAILMALPVFLYRKHHHALMPLWIRMAYDRNAQKLAANILALYVTFFHVTYFAVFPHDIGIMFSTLLVFFLLSNKRSVKLLLAIRRSKYLFIFIALSCVLMLLLPHTLSTSISLAAILECACYFPADGLERFYENHIGDKDVDHKFVDAFFN
jgi:hypothetical protein